MSKKAKKRTKRYSGEDAKQIVAAEPVVHRYEAVQRSKFGQWWIDRKRVIRLSTIAGGVIVVVGWLLIELARTIF